MAGFGGLGKNKQRQQQWLERERLYILTSQKRDVGHPSWFRKMNKAFGRGGEQTTETITTTATAMAIATSCNGNRNRIGGRLAGPEVVEVEDALDVAVWVYDD